MYALLHSPTYRERYSDFLSRDFPRLPLINNRELWWQLVDLGAQLVDLHLLRVPGRYAVGGAGGSELLAKPGRAGLSFPVSGTDPIDKPRYLAPKAGEPGKVYINSTQYFSGIDPETWEIFIGGYQPLHKWLKDRKGRTLDFDDVMHYQRMVIALRETHRLMQEINATIDDWETAFAIDSAD